VGYRFTLILSREVTVEESAILEEAGCAGAVFGSDSLPTNAKIPVTKMDFDVTSSPSLAEAIESALETVKKVPDLSVPGLTVPAQPAHAGTADQASASDDVIEGTVIDDEAAAKTAAQQGEEADGAAGPVEAAAGTS
jgi:hypothetical protein